MIQKVLFVCENAQRSKKAAEFMNHYLKQNAITEIKAGYCGWDWDDQGRNWKQKCSTTTISYRYSRLSLETLKLA